MPDIKDRLSGDADSLLLNELKRLTPGQFSEVIQHLMRALRLDLRKARNKPNYFFAETVSLQDQKRSLLFILKQEEPIGLSDIESLANYAERVRAPRSILMTMGNVSSEAEREAYRRGVEIVNGAEFAELIRKSGIDRMVRKQFAQEAVAIKPPEEEESLEAQLMHGVELMQKGDLPRALEHFERAIAAEPNSEMPWRLKGDVLDQLGEHSKALECYAQALEIDDNNPELWYSIGVSMYSLGRYDEELQCYEKALKIDPRMEKVLVNRGATLLKLGRYKEALESYDKALKLNYRLIKVHNNRGIALRHLGQLEDALKAFESALQLDHEFADAWLNRANLLLQLGHAEGALESLEHLVSLRPGMSQAWILKGEVESRLKKRKAAISSFERALELEPTNEAIRKALDFEKSKIHEEHMDIPTRISSVFTRAGVKVSRPPPIIKEIPEAGIGKEEIEPITDLEVRSEAAEEEEVEEQPVSEGVAEAVEEGVEELAEEEVQVEEMPKETIELDEAAEEPAIAVKDIAEEEAVKVEALEEEEAIEADELEEEIETSPVLITAPEEEFLLEEIGEPPVGVAEEVFGDAAELMLSMRQPEIALEELNKGLRLEPMSVRMILLKGRTQHMLKNDRDAIDLFQRVLELDPSNREAIYSIEYLLFSNREFSGAIEALEPLIDGKHWAAEILAAENSYMLGKLRNTSEHVESAVSLEPSAIIWNFKGLLDLEQGDFESAIEAFTLAHEQKKIFSDPNNNIGVSYFKLGVRAEASTNFEVSLAAYPQSAPTWNNRGVLLYSFDRYDEALSCFDEALAVEKNPMVLINKGFTLLAMDALDEALQMFEESILIAPTPEAYNNKGIVLIRMNRIEDAIDCFEAALHLSPEFDDARGNLERYQPPEARVKEKKEPEMREEEIVEIPPMEVSTGNVWEQLGIVNESTLKRNRKEDLQEICKALGLSTSGIKKELIERIIAAYKVRDM